MSKWFYRLRGFKSYNKNAKTFSAGSSNDYEQAILIARGLLKKKEYIKVTIERSQIIKTIK